MLVDEHCEPKQTKYDNSNRVSVSLDQIKINFCGDKFYLNGDGCGEAGLVKDAALSLSLSTVVRADCHMGKQDWCLGVIGLKQEFGFLPQVLFGNLQVLIREQNYTSDTE